MKKIFKIKTLHTESLKLQESHTLGQQIELNVLNLQEEEMLHRPQCLEEVKCRSVVSIEGHAYSDSNKYDYSYTYWPEQVTDVPHSSQQSSSVFLPYPLDY